MKSPIGIGIYDEAIRRGMIKGIGLIIVKASLKSQWFAEVKKFSDYTARILKTSADCAAAQIRKLAKAEKELKSNPHDINLIHAVDEAKDAVENTIKEQFLGVDLLICNYETLNDEKIRQYLHKLKLEYVYADEIQYIRSCNAKRSKSAYEFNDVKMKAGATATPLQRDPRDIFGIFKFVNPEIFPKKSTFETRYIRWAGFGRVAGAKNTKELNEKISEYTIIKTKEEVSKQLPRLVVTQRYCDMDPKQVKLNESIMDELDELHEQEQKLTGGLPPHLVTMTPELEKVEARILMLQTFAQELCDSEQLLLKSDSKIAKQYTTGKPDAKLNLLIELIEEIIDSGEKVAIFSKFKKMQDIITEKIHNESSKNKLFNFEIAYVNGSLSGEMRYDEIVKFRDDDNCKVLLLSDAGAEGISLGWCSYLIEMELANSYAIQTQRHGRIQRADSVSNVSHVYQLIANNSYDEIAMKIINKKEKYDTQLIHGIGIEEY